MGETLSLLFRTHEDNSYEVQIRESWSGHTVRGTFVPPYTPKQTNVLQKKLNSLQTSDDDLRQIGRRLFDAVAVAEPVREQWPLSVPAESSVQSVFQNVILRTLKRRGTVALTLIFTPGCDEFIRYPWELLHNGNYFLIAAGVFTLSRSLLRPDAPGGCELPVHPPFRILYISASPADFAPLETERSFQAMQEALAPLIDTGQVFLDRLEPPTFGQFVRYFNSYGGTATFDDSDTTLPCYVVHFDGHGSYGKLCPQDDCETINNPEARKCSVCGTTLSRIQPQTYLSFCNEEGNNSFISTQALRGILVSSDVRMAVFSACETATVSDERHDPDALEATQQLTAVDATLATSLVTAQVPAVVAMPFSLQDDLSPTFMYHFYEALADGRTIEEALSRARQALSSMQQRSWFIPVLYRHVVEGEEAPVALLIKADAHDSHAHPLLHLGPAPSFVGREQELHDLEQLLIAATTSLPASNGRNKKGGRPGYRHIALTGAPGIGKSALALEAIRLNRDKFMGGIIGISLEDGKSLHDALLEIVHALPVPTRNTATMDTEQLIRLVHGTLRSLSNRELQCMLLLDSFEEVKERSELDAWLRFLDLLPSEVVVLVTSHSNPENMLVLEGISSRWYEYRVIKMTNQDLLTLFIDLAESSGLYHRIRLQDHQQQEILREICTLLDGYPLGAELIFGTARSIGGQVFTPEAATRSLEEVRDELYDTPLAGIYAVLEVSYQRLSPPARLLVSYLAAFRLPFNREQIAMLISPDTLVASHEPTLSLDAHAFTPHETLASDLLRRWHAARDELVQASFLTFDGHFYSIHSQIRHFALSRLPLEERRRVHRVVAAYYYCLAQPDADEWLEAFTHLEAAGEVQDFREAVRIILRAADTMEGAGHYQSLQGLLRRAIGYATRLGDHTELRQLQYRLGRLLRQLGHYAEAGACLRSSLLLHQQYPEEGMYIGLVLCELALLFYDEGDFSQARLHIQRVEEYSKETRNAQVCYILGMIHYGQAHYSEALMQFEEAMTAFSQEGDIPGRARATHQRANVELCLGHYSRALRDCEEAFRLFHELKRPTDQAWVQLTKCSLQVQQGKLGQAEKAGLELLTRFRDYQLPRGVAVVLRLLGDIAARKQDTIHAHTYYNEAQTLLTPLGCRIDQALTCNANGKLSLAEGTYLDAREYYEQAQSIAEICDTQHINAMACYGLAEVARNMRQCEDARCYYLEADHILQELHIDRGRRQILYGLGLLYEAEQKYATALSAWLQAQAFAEDGEAPTQEQLQERITTLNMQHDLGVEQSQLHRHSRSS
ncbi:CHAT domain-containing protein [Dictyobacter arantiisoli]|uniref:AAA+ ATPase domain-containing protein n=1 Tax=Dictyobacter arantiisoli TaxID=2014874 RepID=A0A5A5T8T5_9CHLR|nr:CHAT domain-containing protein [Dictyobacter arantiisoli]GCF07675.1 hypothetical protein KDI_12390 [Dictyobacter arantiisoli]